MNFDKILKKIKSFEDSAELYFMACAVIVLMVSYQYFPLLFSDFPLEPETRFLFAKFKTASWLETPLYTIYYSIYPVINIIYKICSTVFFFSKTFLYMGMIIIHLGGIFLVFITAEKLINYLISAQILLINISSKSAAIFVTVIFAAFNSYYHGVANPALLYGTYFTYMMVLLYVYLIFKIFKSDTRTESIKELYGVCILIAGILPFMFMISFTFLAVTIILFIFIDSNKKQKIKLIIPIIMVHLISLFIEVYLLDARFSPTSFASKNTMWSPDSFKLIRNYTSDPLTFLMIMFHTAISGIQFGLISQNFLFSTVPYSFSYQAGFLVFLIYIIYAFWNHRIAKINAVLWMIILVNILNLCIMRNPLGGEFGRIFDAYFVASQPRYYYFPAILLSISLGITMISLMQAIYKSKKIFLLLTLLTMSFIFCNMKFSREKIDYLQEHMASEVYIYTPKSLRSPIADPDNPSFILQPNASIKKKCAALKE